MNEYHPFRKPYVKKQQKSLKTNKQINTNLSMV